MALELVRKIFTAILVVWLKYLYLLLENLTSCATFSEPWVRRTAATVQDPVFHKLKIQFTSDFDFSQPGSTKLHNLIIKLRKWIKILECRTRQLPKSFLIEDKCRFLSNFSQKTAEVELPGELLLPRHSHYHIRIARFMPRVDIVQKHNTAARRLHIRGTNGKVSVKFNFKCIIAALINLLNI